MARHRTRWAGVAVAAGLAVAAVSVAAVAAGGRGGSGPDPAHRQAADVPVLLESTDLRLPLDEYRLSPTQNLTLTNAYRTLLGRCLRKFGFDDSAFAVVGRLLGPRTWTERRYGLTEPADARADGYGLGERDPARHPVPREEVRANTSPAERAVVTGTGARQVNGRPVPEGGCAGQAQRELAMRPEGVDVTLGQSLSNDSFNQSRADPRVGEVTRAWSRCMRSAGLDYPTPLDAASDPDFATGLSEQEMATARADLDCKRRTNLVGVWFAVETEYQTTLVAQHQDALRRVRQALRTMLQLATRVGP